MIPPEEALTAFSTWTGMSMRVIVEHFTNRRAERSGAELFPLIYIRCFIDRVSLIRSVPGITFAEQTCTWVKGSIEKISSKDRRTPQASSIDRNSA
jgi:hypothetical protein